MRGSYRGHEIISMPPSSSGGVILIEMLNILEGYQDLAGRRRRRAHLMIEAMKLAYADRALFLGDPAMREGAAGEPHVEGLRRARCARGIDPAARAAVAPTSAPAARCARATTPRISRWSTASATRSSNTYTLNFSYGVGLVAEGTGILLNNELDDFAAKPGVPNAYGLVGGDANAPGPGKRPLSSMTPTIVLKDGKPFLVTGSPGGSRIITDGAAGDLECDRPRHADRRRGRGAAPASSVVARGGRSVERGLPPDLLRALAGARPQAGASGRRGTSANSILVTPQGLGRRRRSAHPRRAGGGVLITASAT